MNKMSQGMEHQEGEELLKSIIELTGVPAQQMQGVVQDILSQTGQTVDALTLDQLRAAMLAYLETLHTNE